MRACIDEALRMAPPAPSVLPRVVESESAIIDTIRVPKGTRVGVSTYSILHATKYFEEPFVYSPERWMTSAANEPHTQLKADRSAFVPLSVGRHSCLGKSLAMTETLLTLTHILWELDFKPAVSSGNDTGNPIYQCKEYMNAEAEGPSLQFRRRV